MNYYGQNFVGTVVRMLISAYLSVRLNIPQNEGDLWFFPPGVPHSLQATNATEDGAEFLLVGPEIPRHPIFPLKC